MLSKEQILERNKLIGENGLKTRMKRAKQICKTFRFKIDYNNLNKQQKRDAEMRLFNAWERFPKNKKSPRKGKQPG